MHGEPSVSHRLGLEALRQPELCDRIIDVSHDVERTKHESTANGVSAVKVARARRTGEVKPVYNLTVDETHNFAVNGGLVTHNCDAMRYFVQTVGLQELSCFEWD